MSSNSMWDKLRDAWATRKGGLVVAAWGTAIAGVTVWSIQRRRIEHEIEKDIMIHEPQSVTAKKSMWELRQSIKKEEQKRINTKKSNMFLIPLKDINENTESDDDFDEESYYKLRSEQAWSLWHLSKRMFPNFANSAVLYSLSLPAFMMVWYYFRGKVKNQNSKLASYLTNKKWDKLFPATVDLALWSIPASCCARIMTSFTQQISLSVRTNLSNYYTSKYLSEECSLYRMNNILDYCDQRLTNDIEKFSNEFAQLYNSILWSFGGVLMLSISLMTKMGLKEFLLAIGYAMISRQVVSILSPSFSDLTELLQLSEARFRGFHSKICEYCEEIEILGGGNIELDILKSYWKQVEKSTQNYYNCTMISQMFGSYFTGEIGNLIGYIAMVPAIYYAAGGDINNINNNNNNNINTKNIKNNTKNADFDDAANDTVAYLTTIVQELSFLTKLFEKVFRIGNKWHEVNGFAHRIVELEKGINDTIELANKELNRIDGKLDGNINDIIILENVTIATPGPNSDILIENLSIEIRPGMHTFIEGPNGVGKTSIFRIIGGLWQPYYQKAGVRLTIPNNEDNTQSNLFLLSQRPYIVGGLNFRQQLCYPKTIEQMLNCLNMDSEHDLEDLIYETLEFVGLKELVFKRGGLTGYNICDGLSGGEKQRVGMARCILHKPKFALLDECSSAVSIDLEENFFKKCRDSNITLITIAHNKDLKKYHEQCLSISPDKTWNVSRLN